MNQYFLSDPLVTKNGSILFNSLIQNLVFSGHTTDSLLGLQTTQVLCEHNTLWVEVHILNHIVNLQYDQLEALSEVSAKTATQTAADSGT